MGWVLPVNTNHGAIVNYDDNDFMIHGQLNSPPSFRYIFEDTNGTRWRGRDTGSLAWGVWHHVAATYSAFTTDIKIYADGELKGTETNDGFDLAAHGGDNLTIGERSLGPSYLEGKLDEIMVYDTALTHEEVVQNMLNYHNPVHFNNLVGWWRFEEGTGLTAHDKSGNGNDGTLNPSNDPPIWRDVKKWELRSEVGL